MLNDREAIKVRHPTIEGIFYTDIKEDLICQINSEISKAKDCLLSSHIKNQLPAIILSPHAAFAYSVDIQARAWAAVSQCNAENIVIIARSHSPQGAGIFLPESTVFTTMLGKTEVNTHLCTELESCSTLFTVNDIPHLESNSIEMQLLFMQSLFPKARLVPILINGDSSTITSLSKALDTVFTDKLSTSLFVVSSNLISSQSPEESDSLSTKALIDMEKGDWHSIANQKLLKGGEAIASIMASRVFSKLQYKLLARTDSKTSLQVKTPNTVNYAAVLWN